jgi:AcrR family transcriptional regulator
MSTKQGETTRDERAQPPPPASRMAADERRQQIVTVAMRLFSERGFRGTTTKEIAQAAGVSEAIIFRHFATKNDLYAAIIDHKACAGGMADLTHPVAEAIQCAVADAVARKDDRAVFEGIAGAMMEHHQRDPDFLRLLLFSALEGHVLAQMFWDRNVRSMYEFLSDYIRGRQKDKAFREVDPRVVVRAFTGMLIHHSLNNTLWDKPRRLLDISDTDAACEFAKILLQGIECDARPGQPRGRRHEGRVKSRRRKNEDARK